MAGQDDRYSRDPQRNPVLQVVTQKPFNAEPPVSLLIDSFNTDTELFFIRNHLPVPVVDAAAYRLTVEGVGLKPTVLSFDEIKAFPKHTVNATVKCAGNRRMEMLQLKNVYGPPWAAAAIGNATWSGAKLRDVLLAAGLEEDQPGVRHIQFEGLDIDTDKAIFGASIPVEKAMDPHGDTVLAYEMNGAALTRDHGFPVRIVVPGIAGARSVKWLARIIASEEENQSRWQQMYYKGFSPSTDMATVDFSTAPAIQELPVTSTICMPTDGSTVYPINGKVTVRGYAYSGGGNKVIRVDVTADAGKTWHVADLTDEDKNARVYRYWTWSFWQVDVPVPEEVEELELWVKAVDSFYNTQPERVENIWNLAGVLNTSYHKVRVVVGRS